MFISATRPVVNLLITFIQFKKVFSLIARMRTSDVCSACTTVEMGEGMSFVVVRESFNLYLQAAAMVLEIQCCDNADSVSAELKSLIQIKADDVIRAGSLFKIGLSGGSLVKTLGNILPTIDTDWKKWRFFFCDERHVPYSDSESNFGLYRSELFDKIPISEEQFVLSNPELSVEEAAENYHQKMLTYFPSGSFPQFDMLLLGMGPDGHTCSLFPNHALLKEDKKWVSAINDSPKPPPQRITLTLPVINNAKCCVFAIAGESKASTVKDVLENHPGHLPASLVNPKNGSVHWILDKAAASLLKGNQA